jgi:SAM-dependent methyltransferase
MRELAFTSGLFDAAINLDASVGHLPTDADVIRHLRSVHAHLRPGGIYLLGITVLDLPRRQDKPEALFESEPVAVGEGTVTVKYTSLWRDPNLRRERIALEMHSRGVPDAPPLLREEYDLLTFAPADLHRCLAQAGGWHLLAVHDMTLDDFPDHGFQPGCRGVTVVLRAVRVSE